MILLRFASQSLQITVEWLRQGSSLLRLRAKYFFVLQLRIVNRRKSHCHGSMISCEWCFGNIFLHFGDDFPLQILFKSDSNLRGGAASLHASLRDEVESLDANLRGEVESLRANLRGGVESLRENSRGGAESLQANLRPWTRMQAFAGKWWCKFTLEFAWGVESLPANLRGEVESGHANWRGGVESLRANFR